MLQMNVSMDDLKPVIQQFDATETQVKRAAVRSLKRVASTLGTQVKKSVAAEANIPVKALKNRVKGEQVQNDPVLRIWFGANPVPLSAIGKPRQTRAGVRFGRFPRLYRGAFIATMPNGYRGAFIRYSSKHYTSALYPRAGGPNMRPSARFPIYAPKPIDISGEMEEAIDRLGPKTFELFQRRFAEELNYETNVRGR